MIVKNDYNHQVFILGIYWFIYIYMSFYIELPELLEPGVITETKSYIQVSHKYEDIWFPPFWSLH